MIAIIILILTSAAVAAVVIGVQKNKKKVAEEFSDFAKEEPAKEPARPSIEIVKAPKVIKATNPAKPKKVKTTKNK